MEKLQTILNDMLSNLGLSTLDELKPSLHLSNELEIDSISYAELVVNIESEFGININEQGRAETVGDLLERLKLV